MAPKKRRPEIARRLRAIRESSGLNVADFARVLSISSQRWHNYEAGARVPELDVLCALQGKLGINLNWLLCGTGPPRLEAPSEPAAIALANLARAKLK